MSKVNVKLNREEKWVKTCYASLTDVTKENEKKKSIVQIVYIYILSKCLCQQKNVAKSFPDFLSNQ